ncbi:Plant disease resistance response protein [Macleaya cordata]|uniref:Dirigent protein n=1 Tax=Macleaya cordata TaxID=56857 RepID=A0A200QN03_MACCD|nr:Plant disease resistance response protein [Macleaya cordata]
MGAAVGHVHVVLMLQYLSLVIVMVLLVTQTLAHEPDWGQTLPYEEMMGKAKVTRLHFYFHGIASGKDPTSVSVDQPASTNKSSTMFGLVVIVDDPLTEGPDLATSRLVGRAQGPYGFAGQKKLALIMALTYVFTDEKFNGSTLSILARNPVMNPVREFPIVGGTGLFRFARGFAILIKLLYFGMDLQ